MWIFTTDVDLLRVEVRVSFTHLCGVYRWLHPYPAVERHDLSIHLTGKEMKCFRTRHCLERRQKLSMLWFSLVAKNHACMITLYSKHVLWSYRTLNGFVAQLPYYYDEL